MRRVLIILAVLIVVGVAAGLFITAPQATTDTTRPPKPVY